jgi:hypothetical protein
MASVGGDEEQKDELEEETEPSVHDQDSDYVPESTHGDDDLPVVPVTYTPGPTPNYDDDTDDGIEDVTPTTTPHSASTTPHSPNMVQAVLTSAIQHFTQTPSFRRLAPRFLPALTRTAAAFTSPPSLTAATIPAAAPPGLIVTSANIAAADPTLPPPVTAPSATVPPTLSPPSNDQGGDKKPRVRVKIQTPTQQYDARVISTVRTYFREVHGCDIPAALPIADQLELYAELGPNFASQFKRHEQDEFNRRVQAAEQDARRSFSDQVAAAAAASAAAAAATAISAVKRRTKTRREKSDDDNAMPHPLQPIKSLPSTPVIITSRAMAHGLTIASIVCWLPVAE